MTRTPAYYVMRVCERWGWREGEFCQLPWEEQVRLLAWERVRMEEGDQVKSQMSKGKSAGA